MSIRSIPTSTASRMSTVVESEMNTSLSKQIYSATTPTAQVAQRKRIITRSIEVRNKAMQKEVEAKGQEEEKPKRRITASVKETGFDSMKYYMKTMGNHELLKKNEEIILAREIQILIKWEAEREDLEAKLMRYVSCIRLIILVLTRCCSLTHCPPLYL